MRKIYIVIFVLALITIVYITFQQTYTPQSSPASVSPKQVPTISKETQSEIEERDNGKSFTYFSTDRFWFVLDPAKYPLKDLNVNCSKGGSIGRVSNLSTNGPENYPSGYEAVLPGVCVVTNGNFSVEIIVSDK